MADTLWPIHKRKHESWFPSLLHFQVLALSLSLPFFSLWPFSFRSPFVVTLFSVLLNPIFFILFSNNLPPFSSSFSHSPQNPRRFFVSHLIFPYTFVSIAINNNSTMIFSSGFPFSHFYFSHSVFAISPFSPFLSLLPLLLSPLSPSHYSFFFKLSLLLILEAQNLTSLFLICSWREKGRCSGVQ